MYSEVSITFLENCGLNLLSSPPYLFTVEGANFGWAHWWRVPASRKQHDPFPLLGHSNLLSNAPQLWCLHCDALSYFDVYFDRYMYLYIYIYTYVLLRFTMQLSPSFDPFGDPLVMALTVTKHTASLLSTHYLIWVVNKPSCSFFVHSHSIVIVVLYWNCWLRSTRWCVGWQVVRVKDGEMRGRKSWRQVGTRSSWGLYHWCTSFHSSDSQGVCMKTIDNTSSLWS